MDVGTTAQVLTMVLAAVAIIWNQQRSVGALRAEMREEIGALRSEMRQEIGVLRSDLAAHGERLARIEGYFGIDMPTPAASVAAGASLVERSASQRGG